MGQISVAVANDYELVVAGLAKMLEQFRTELEIVDMVTLDGGVTPPPRMDPVDVLLFDTFGRVQMGLSAVRTLARDPRVRHLVVYSWDVRPFLVERALALGASGCISKGVSGLELVAALRRVVDGQRVVATEGRPTRSRRDEHLPGHHWGLTHRESEVVALLAAGLRNREIAEALFVSVDTVKSHLAAAFRKLGVRNRAEAVAAVLADGGFESRSVLRPPS